ncbi:uncharacterized protein V1510DRAFT_412241 [Dipodascopsis tothii]|uniref:uncharacterized protein n=1 Tax=Dipodascopsis tothii TaxID=44089 RepID=UPI0034CF34A8
MPERRQSTTQEEFAQGEALAYRDFSESLGPTDSSVRDLRDPRTRRLSSSPTLDGDTDCDQEKDAGSAPGAGAPKRLGFFDREFRDMRRKTIIKILVMLATMATLTLGTLSIYWASNYEREKYVRKTSVWVVNMDDGTDAIVGPAFQRIVSAYAASVDRIKVEMRSGADFGYDQARVDREVTQEKIWGAFTIARNATSAMLAALQNPSSNAAVAYDPLTASSFTYPSTRDYTSYVGVYVPWATAAGKNFTAQFAADLYGDAASHDISLSDVASNRPLLLALPVGMALRDLRPLPSVLENAATQVGLLYLIIVSFFQFNFFQPVHQALGQVLHPRHYIMYRLLVSWVAYFLLSLFYSLLSLAFQVDFTAVYGKAGFVIYWLCNFLGMAAVGGACENMAMVIVPLCPPLIGYWLIFWVVSNVSATFTSIPLMPSVFKYGYAFPLHNLSQIAKTVLFNTKNTIGLNLGVIIAWIAVNTALMPLCMLFFKTQMTKKAQAEAAAKAAAAAAAGEKGAH